MLTKTLVCIDYTFFTGKFYLIFEQINKLIHGFSIIRVLINIIFIFICVKGNNIAVACRREPELLALLTQAAKPNPIYYSASRNDIILYSFKTQILITGWVSLRTWLLSNTINNLIDYLNRCNDVNLCSIKRRNRIVQGFILL